MKLPSADAETLDEHVRRFEEAGDDYSAIMLKALADRLAQIETPGSVTVRIELHPNGPVELADEVAALAHERGLKTEITTEAAPFITPDRPGEAQSTGAETPEAGLPGDELPDGEPDPLAY